jgi:hypothetical protein
LIKDRVESARNYIDELLKTINVWKHYSQPF